MGGSYPALEVRVEGKKRRKGEAFYSSLVLLFGTMPAHK